MNEKLVLAKGVKFVPTPKPLDKEIILSNFTKFGRSMKLRYFFRNKQNKDYNHKLRKPQSAWEPNHEEIPQSIHDYLSLTRQTLIKKMNKSTALKQKNLKSNSRKTLQKLIRNKNLIIKPSDKNLGITLLSKNDYTKEALRLLSDSTTYAKVEKNTIPGEDIRHWINFFIVKHRSKFSDFEWNYLNYYSEQKTIIPKFYIIPKIHKTPWSGRPIVASHSWITTPISKIVDVDLCDAVRQHCNTVIQDSNSVIKKYQQKPIPAGIKELTFITADVETLYPKIPIIDGLNATSKFLGEIKHHRRDVIMTFLDKILFNNYLEFNQVYYKQLCGTAMGTPCAPNYANIFLYMLERIVVQKYFNIIYDYSRFIDDISCILIGHYTLEHPFFKDLNNMHPSIRLSIKISYQSSDFLDITTYKGALFYNNSI